MMHLIYAGVAIKPYSTDRLVKLLKAARLPKLEPQIIHAHLPFDPPVRRDAPHLRLLSAPEPSRSRVQKNVEILDLTDRVLPVHEKQRTRGVHPGPYDSRIDRRTRVIPPLVGARSLRAHVLRYCSVTARAQDNFNARIFFECDGAGVFVKRKEIFKALN